MLGDQVIILNNIFHDSAVHHFKGKIPGDVIERIEGIRVNLSGYIFEGSIDYPLTFRCILDKGYVYIGGVGKVILMDGTEVALGKESYLAKPPFSPNIITRNGRYAALGGRSINHHENA